MNALRHLLFGKEHRIGRRLIVLIIGFSSLITLILSIAQLTLEYHSLRAIWIANSIGWPLPRRSSPAACGISTTGRSRSPLSR
jgi:hypothetical protein